METSKAESITEFLTRDHERLDALLERSIADPERFDYEAYAVFREGLLRHVAIEEKILMLDARRRRGGEALPVFPQIRLEHSAIALLLVPTPDHALMREIRSILEVHNEREEGPDGMYAACERLAGDEAADLLARAKEAPKVPVARHYDGPRSHRTAQSALAYAAKGASKYT
ncbi:MAG TPA: hemerythrin domain-containing protein [Vulgatibacter sp.]|nr:hemerythrin domain-containing protein [Vulgatibacter sp.]